MFTELVLFSLAVPIAISFGLLWLARSYGGELGGYGSTAVVLGLFIPGWLIVGNEIFLPARHWHWLPAIAAGSWLITLIGLRRNSSWLFLGIWAVLLAIGSAFLLVPNWSDLDSVRVYWIAGLAGGLFVSQMAWVYAARHRPGWTAWMLAGLALLSAGWIARFYSVSNSRWLMITAGASLGVGLHRMLWKRRRKDLDLSEDKDCDWRMFLPLSLWIGAGLFVGLIEPNPPRYELVFPLGFAVVFAAFVGCLHRKPRVLAIRD